MRNLALKFYVKTQSMREIVTDETGQDLIEYALVVSLIAFAAIVSMQTLATNINNAFVSIGTKLAAAA